MWCVQVLSVCLIGHSLNQIHQSLVGVGGHRGLVQTRGLGLVLSSDRHVVWGRWRKAAVVGAGALGVVRGCSGEVGGANGAYWINGVLSVAGDLW